MNSFVFAFHSPWHGFGNCLIIVSTLNSCFRILGETFIKIMINGLETLAVNMKLKIYEWKHQLEHFQFVWAEDFRSHTLGLTLWIDWKWKMSFFSSLVANVTSGVANLSSRRFSLSRLDTTDGTSQDINSKSAVAPSITVSSSSNLSTQHGEWFFHLPSTWTNYYFLFARKKRLPFDRSHLCGCWPSTRF